MSHKIEVWVVAARGGGKPQQGYQARCTQCTWKGSTHLAGPGKTMGAMMNAAQTDKRTHEMRSA